MRAQYAREIRWKYVLRNTIRNEVEIRNRFFQVRVTRCALDADDLASDIIEPCSGMTPVRMFESYHLWPDAAPLTDVERTELNELHGEFCNDWPDVEYNTIYEVLEALLKEPRLLALLTRDAAEECEKETGAPDGSQ